MQQNLLKTNLERFGFGAKSGVAAALRVDGPHARRRGQEGDSSSRGVLAKGEVPRLVVGDNVQVAIGQGLMAATPLQLADAYSTIANGGFLLRPTIVKAIYAPLTPDVIARASPTSAAGTVVQSFDGAGDHATSWRCPPSTGCRSSPDSSGHLRQPRRALRALRRVRPGASTTPTTGETPVPGLPDVDMPIAGKTGTAQGAGQYSVERLVGVRCVQRRPEQSKPYTVVAYLEKSGYGSKAAAPVTKCVFTALAGKVTGGWTRCCQRPARPELHRAGAAQAAARRHAVSAGTTRRCASRPRWR